MGLLSGLGSALFGDASGDIGRAGQEALGYQQQGVDYLRGLDKPLIDYRDQANQQLFNYFSGGPESQQQFVDTARSSPFYNAMIQQGQEGVLGNAGRMGLSRSGNTAQDLNQSNQNVLQNLVNQNLMGLRGFTNPNLSSGNIAQIYSNMGQTAGDVGTAQAQANQSGAGNVLGGLLGLGGFLSDERLKKDIEYLGKQNGHEIYGWKWNDLAEKTFGIKGKSTGVIAQKIKEYAPHLVNESGPFMTVNYGGLDVNHG